MTGVYAITCPGGKSYVGSSVDIHARWRCHVRALRADTHHNPKLQRAWNTHAERSFSLVILETCSVDELTAMEQKHIDALGQNAHNINPATIAARKRRRQDELVRVLVTADLKKKATKLADAAEVSLSAWTRSLMLRAIEAADAP